MEVPLIAFDVGGAEPPIVEKPLTVPEDVTVDVASAGLTVDDDKDGTWLLACRVTLIMEGSLLMMMPMDKPSFKIAVELLRHERSISVVHESVFGVLLT